MDINKLPNRSEYRLLYIFAGTIGGCVFLSTNMGGIWNPVNTVLGTVSVISLAIKDTNIFAGTPTAGVFLSTDNGSNWTPANTGLGTNDVYTFAISDTNIFAGTFGGGMFLSTNNGSNWNAVNTGITNFDVLSSTTSGTDIFAGTSGGVFLTTNNGNNWNVMNTGLTALDTITSFILSGTNIFCGADAGGVHLSNNSGSTWTAENFGFPTNPATISLAISGGNIFAGTERHGVWTRPLSDMISSVGIEEIRNNLSLSISPNPFTSQTTISFSAEQKNTTIKITDLLGKEIKTINFTGRQLTIEKGELKEGIYFVQTTDEQKNICNKKVVIQ